MKDLRPISIIALVLMLLVLATDIVTDNRPTVDPGGMILESHPPINHPVPEDQILFAGPGSV